MHLCRTYALSFTSSSWYSYTNVWLLPKRCLPPFEAIGLQCLTSGYLSIWSQDLNRLPFHYQFATRSMDWYSFDICSATCLFVWRPTIKQLCLCSSQANLICETFLASRLLCSQSMGGRCNFVAFKLNYIWWEKQVCLAGKLTRFCSRWAKDFFPSLLWFGRCANVVMSVLIWCLRNWILAGKELEISLHKKADMAFYFWCILLFPFTAFTRVCICICILVLFTDVSQYDWI